MQISNTILFVSDMAAATAFYRDVVGLPLRFESPEWTEFATEGSTVALHSTPGAKVERPADGTTLAGTAQVGFRLADPDAVAAFHARMQEHGVACLREPQELHGVMLASYEGFDGLPFGVSAPMA